MKRSLFALHPSLLIFLTVATSCFGSEPWDNVSEADRLLMGDYQGEWQADAPEKSYQYINPSLAAQVINVDEGRYEVRFMQELEHRAEPYFEGEATLKASEIVHNADGWDFSVSKEGLQGKGKVGGNVASFSLKRVVRPSPTLGAAAPEGATILFDGTSFNQWEHTDGREVTWTLHDDGSMEINPSKENPDADPPIGGAIQTKKRFGSATVHLEFRYPVEPGKSGQGRGNSGFFLQDYYEAQVLNSYGLHGYWNELGSLYKLSPPKVNAARPPMQWQTYDIDYTVPAFKKGKLESKGRMTVWLNGILVQDDIELDHSTAHREADRENPPPSKPAPFSLQDHSNRIQFRNIWAIER